MILVPNLQLPSNGSKLFWICALMVCLFSSCDLFKKAQPSNPDDVINEKEKDLDPIQGKRVFDPETGTYVFIEETPTEKMDTIVWKRLAENDYPPITSETSFFVDSELSSEVIGEDTRFGGQFLSSYRISLMLPFLTNRFDATSGNRSENSDYALNFYGGARMALEELGAEGIKLQVDVFDSKANDRVVYDILRNNSTIAESHLIIGPYQKQNVRMVADYAKQREIPFVSPYSSSANLSMQNPFYLQVSPPLRAHCEAILSNALDRFQPEQIVLVARDKKEELERFEYFQNAYKQSTEDGIVEPLEEFIISSKSVDLEEMDLLPFFELKDTMVFIVPSFSNETFIYNFLRKLDLARTPGGYVIVYGMPQWMEYEKIDYDYYEKLNVTVSSDAYINPQADAVRFFRKRFFDRYGAIPSKDAFLGYDITLFFGRMLQKYGTRFQYYLDQEVNQYLHTKFEILPEVAKTSRFGLEKFDINQFQNKFLNILEFEDYQFQPKPY
ncbi:MAG: ABC transporter substrate-binding protein [Bacteroidota bacterium]